MWLSDPDIGKALDVLNAALELDCTEGPAENMAVCSDPVDDLFFGVFGIPVIKLIYQVSVILVWRIAVADIQRHIIDIHGERHKTDVSGFGVLHHRQVAAHPVDGVLEPVLRQQLAGTAGWGYSGGCNSRQGACR